MDKKAGRQIKWTQDKIEFLRENYSKIEINELAKILGLKKGSVMSNASRFGIRMLKNHKYRNHGNKDDVSHIVKNISSPEVAYILGFLWADGWLFTATKKRRSMSVNIKIIKEDMDDVSDLFLKFVNWNVYQYLPKNRKPVTQLNFSNEELYYFLINNDYLDKSGISADKILSKIPEDLHCYWFRGLCDGDANIDTTHITISSCYDQNWKYLEALANKLNMEFTIKRYVSQKTGHKSSSFIIPKKTESLKFLKYIYKDNIFGLKRKYDKFINMLSREFKFLKQVHSD